MTAERVISYSRGRDKLDAYPVQRSADGWDVFFKALLSDRSARKGGTYLCAPLGANGDGTHHRCRDGVQPRQWLALDLDGSDPEEFVVLCMRLSPYLGVGWTTASHTRESPHMRIILALSRAVDRAEGIRAGAGLVATLSVGLGRLVWDRSTHRGEQPCYLALVDADVMTYHGDPVDVEAMLAAEPEQPARERATTTDPYRALLIERDLFIREIGPGKDAIRCPFASEHSEETSDTSTVYLHPLHAGCLWGRIHCLHAHCTGRGQNDYIRALGVEPRTIWKAQSRQRISNRFVGGGNYEADHENTHGEAAGTATTVEALVPPIIDVRAGEIPRIVADAIAALRCAEVPIYDRGGALYRPMRIEAPSTCDGVRRPTGAVVLRPVDPTWLRVKLAGSAQWQKWDGRDKEMRPADPPKNVCETIASQSDLGGWPFLRAVVRHPLMITPDGRVLSTPGYDPETGLLIDIAGDWPIPEAPTRDIAVAACARLVELLRNYPWVSIEDRAVALSMLVTAIARPVLPAAPMHCVDSPEPGSGKSLLVDAAAILASGAPASVMDFGRDPVEAGKRLDAMMLAGDPLIAIDNVEAPLEGAVLCQSLTQTTRRIRVMGGHTVVTVPCVQLITATGCNLTLKGDIVRRAIVCRLDPRTAQPELRTIDQDLIAEVHERRPDIVADILTVMLAYQRARRPNTGVSPMGGFRPWSQMVREALVWAGEADPCRTMERIRGDDPSRQDMAAVLHAWREAYGDDAMTAAEAVARAEHDADLREALAAVCEMRGDLDSRRLGYWLRTHRDRRSGRLVLRAGPSDGHRKVSRWAVHAGDAGNCG